METKIKSTFKSVDFMRKVRDELSELYQTDKFRYHQELKKTMNDFILRRSKSASNIDLG